MSSKKSETVSPVSPPTSIARIDVRQLQPLPPVIPYGTSNYLFTLSGQLIQPVAVDFNKDGSFWSKLHGNTGTLFSKSTIGVPESFHLVTNIHLVDANAPLSIQDITNMETANIQLSPTKIKFDLVHSINTDKAIEHPCIAPVLPTLIHTLSTESTTEKEKPSYLGGKTCAYNTYVAIYENGTFKPVHLIFYVKNVAKHIIKKLRDQYPSVQQSGLAAPIYSDTNEDVWKNLFAIPIMNPDGSLIYHIVPASTEGKNYLLSWLSRANKASKAVWTAVDDVFMVIDDWESVVTLDVRFK